MDKSLDKWILLLTLLVGAATARDQSGNAHLVRCIKMAEPLVQNPEYIFPLSKQDIRGVCRMWDGFQVCVNEYTGTYLTPNEKQEFNLAIRTSIESINQLCDGGPDYERSYLAYSPCLKRVSIDSAFCGGQYQYLADLVQGSSATDAQLCCAHHKFRDCVLDKTALECDKDGIASGSHVSASRFMRDMIDRALGFLLRKCRDFVPNARDCPKTSLLNPTTSTTTINSLFGSGNDNYNNNNNNIDNNLGNNQYLRPDSTTSAVSSTSPRSTTRFTWTTKGSLALSGGSTSPPISFIGNDLQEPESQQFRGGALGVIPCFIKVALSIATVFVFRL